MRSIEVLQVDAFTQTPFHGNPAGVVLTADGLDDASMQNIAREMNCSETVFVTAPSSQQLRFRYFTPSTEVDLCGHATIAALTVLQTHRGISGSLRVETNAGLLSMEIGLQGDVWMEQAPPKFQEVGLEWSDSIAKLIGLEAEDLLRGIPLGLAYTGLWDLMVPVRSLGAVHRANPDYAGLAALNRKQGAASTHVYCFETELSESTLHARDFSPAVGVPEDPHTGTASGALGAWLVHNKVLESGRFIFEQGWSVGRPGLIHVQIRDNPITVRVGGYAITVLKGAMILEGDNE